jgi:hypothetical protein
MLGVTFLKTATQSFRTLNELFVSHTTELKYPRVGPLKIMADGSEKGGEESPVSHLVSPTFIECSVTTICQQ